MTLRRFILLLVLAAGATVVGAWGPSTLWLGGWRAGTDRWSEDLMTSRTAAPFLTTWGRLWATQVGAPAVVPPGSPAEAAAERQRLLATPLIRDAAPSISWAPGTSFTHFRVDHWGWPLRCVWSWVTLRQDSSKQPPTVSQRTGGQVVLNPGRFPPRSLPYRPIWWGLIGNIAVYFVLFAGLDALRRRMARWRRRSRGLCAECGYDLRGTSAGLPCPECGKIAAR